MDNRCTCKDQPQWCFYCLASIRKRSIDLGCIAPGTVVQAPHTTYGFPQSSGIPSTARAIMDLVPERKVPPLTDKQQAQGEGISRAVDRLSQHEPRLGAARWVP